MHDLSHAGYQIDRKQDEGGCENSPHDVEELGADRGTPVWTTRLQPGDVALRRKEEQPRCTREKIDIQSNGYIQVAQANTSLK
jgi:hypothetical protein